MLYDYYSKTHRSVSPLTVDAEAFCAELPRTAFCQMEDGDIEHFAFVQLEEGECVIAYVGTRRLAVFNPFAQSLIAELFRERDLIAAECDDVDPAAMQTDRKGFYILLSGNVIGEIGFKHIDSEKKECELEICMQNDSVKIRGMAHRQNGWR